MGPPKFGAPGNCPICPPLKPALTPISPSILMPTTFNYILTAQTPLQMPLADSPPVSSPYTNGLPPTP